MGAIGIRALYITAADFSYLPYKPRELSIESWVFEEHTRRILPVQVSTISQKLEASHPCLSQKTLSIYLSIYKSTDMGIA